MGQKHSASDCKETAHWSVKDRRYTYCDSNFVVTAPRNMSENIVEQFIIRKSKDSPGICSKKGNLNFNYKIALLPERLVS